MPILRLPADVLALLLDLPADMRVTPDSEDEGVAMVEIAIEPNATHDLRDGRLYAAQYEEDEYGEPALVAFHEVR